MQDAWTQSFMYSERRRETSLKRAVTWWEFETARLKAALLEAAQLTPPLQIMHVGSCVAKEARDYVAKRPQLAT